MSYGKSDAVCKSHVDNGLKDTSIIRSNAHVDFKDKNLDNFRFFKFISTLAVEEHLTTKNHVDHVMSSSVDEPTLVKKYQDKKFNKINLTNIYNNTLTTQAVIDNQVITKSHVDHFPQQNELFRTDLGINFSNESSDSIKKQDNKFNNNKSTILDSVRVNGNPS